MTDIADYITCHKTVDALIELLRERLTNSVNSEIASFCGAFASLTDVTSATQDEQESAKAADIPPAELMDVAEGMDCSQDNTMNESSALDASYNEFGSATVDMVLMRMLKSAGLLLMHTFNEESVNYS